MVMPNHARTTARAFRHDTLSALIRVARYSPRDTLGHVVANDIEGPTANVAPTTAAMRSRLATIARQRIANLTDGRPRAEYERWPRARRGCFRRTSTRGQPRRAPKRS